MSCHAPIFIIGLPRSGSTLLSRLLNETPDIFSFNDLYYLQLVCSENATDAPLHAGKVHRFSQWIFDLATERSCSNNNFLGQFKLPTDDINKIEAVVAAQYRDQEVRWHVLMDDILTRLARLAGKERWADKTPQNFRHLPLLTAAFPGALFLFLFRDPRHILASYKYAKGEGHDSRRYHPLAYAFYWRSAIRQYLSSHARPEVAMVRYEDLMKDYATTINKLNQFLGTSIPTVDFETMGDNTSFTAGKRKEINGTEQWICQKICGHEMTALGYTLKPCHFHLYDLYELLLISLRFSFFQCRRLFSSKDGRKRIALFINQTLHSQG